MDQSKIRNFCIIAHIDHGKSTLADRLLELTGTVEKRQMKAQILDKMELEQERGITIKLAPVRMKYKDYELNLIDTPGHVDFSYEVSRSLEAVEGAILVVDASQGIQAQTLANVYLALAADLKIIPALNKIDLPAADVEKVSAEVVSLLGCKPEEILKISAKTGQGVEEVLERVVADVPPPQGKADSSTRALIFDSYYDDYRGVILYLRIVDGEITKNSQIKMLATDAEGISLEVGSLNPEMKPAHKLAAGEIGYIVTNLKTTREAKVGDTVGLVADKLAKSLPGYKNVQPFVYAGFFPDSHENYQLLKDAVERLSLSDSALQYSPENSPVLGFGFRIGFLGLLHMDIVRERLTREYSLELIVTNPSTDKLCRCTIGCYRF
jgi:GTP-binding protein LepA